MSHINFMIRAYYNLFNERESGSSHLYIEHSSIREGTIDSQVYIN